MSRGKRYDTESKLNMKKVFAVVMAIAVIIMFVIGIKTLLTTDTKEKTTIISSYYPCFTNEKWGVIDQTGTIVIEPIYDEMITIPDSKRDVFICMQDVNYEANTYTVKVLNAKNKEILANYDLVEAIENVDKNNNMWYEEGVLKVKKGEFYGLVDFSGKEILAPEYQEITALSGIKNILLLKKEDKYGLCDNKGKIIIPTEYKEIKSIGDNYQNGYIVVNSENKYGVIDFDAKVILEAKYEEIKPVTKNYMYVVKQDGKWKVINKEEDTVLEDKFSDVTEILEDKIIIAKNKKYGVLLTTGEEKIKPQYEELSALFGDYYLAKNKGKYGVINSENETILPFEYSEITYQKEGDFILANKEGVLTQELYNNKWEKQFDGVVSDINTKNGYFRVYKEEEYKYYNFKFEEKTAQEVLTGNTLFLSKKDGKYGYVNKDGNVVIDYIYEDATELNQYGFAAVKQDGIWGAIDKTGAVVVKPSYDLTNNVMIDFIGKWHLASDLNSYYYTDK